MTYDITMLPTGKVIVTYQIKRPGFTVPEGVLFGVFNTRERADKAIRDLGASDNGKGK